MKRLLITLCYFCLAWPVEAAEKNDINTIQLKVSPPFKVLFNFPDNACDIQDIPDAPGRVFRDNKGILHLFASGFINRALSGKNIYNLSHSCDITYKGGHKSDPSQYNDYGWLTSFYTTNGIDIFALVHNEFHGNERPSLCATGVYQKCWENSITTAASTDGGKTFTRSPGKSSILNLPYKYKGDRTLQFGYFNPSDIVYHDGYYYFLASVIDPDNNFSGVCLVRNADLFKQEEWRGWDGNAFTVRFIDPYKETYTGPHCKPIKNLFFSLGSVSYFPEQSTFIAVSRHQAWELKNDKRPIGIYISKSTDLINWTTPQLLLSDEQAIAMGSIHETVQFYPSIITIDDNKKNETQNREAYLLTIEFNWKTVNKKRRLLLWPLHLN